MAGEDQISTPEDVHPEDAERRRRAAVLPGLVLLAALLAVLWLIWTYSVGPATVTDNELGGTPAPAAVTVPDVVGLGEDDAVRILSDAGFSVTVDSSFDVLAPLGTVATQEPGAGSPAVKGAVVTIAVVVDSPERDAAESADSEGSSGGSSGGSGQVTVTYTSMPRVLGLSEKSALNKITAAGLDPRPMYQPRLDSVGEVYEQDPAPGTRVERGRKVFVLIGSMD